MRRLHSSILSGAAIVLLAVASFAAPQSARGADGVTPAAFLDSFGARAIKVMSETEPGDPRRESDMRVLLDDGFDIEFIGRFVLARFWRTASEDERADFYRLFKDYLVAAYGRRFGTYNGERFAIGQTVTAEDDPNKAVVRSEVVRANGDTFVVDWRLLRREGAWRVIDVMVEGVSMMVTQRSEFTALIQREGGSVKALNERLRVLTAQLNDQAARKS